jgi:shikimate dehydrogenase
MGGLWATIPHKSALLALLTHCDRRGQLAQAVNAVRRHADGTLEGALFDGLGFVKSLDGWGVPCNGARALVVGMGGAGTAIAVSLAERGVAELSLYGLDAGAVQTVATRIGLAFPDVRVQLADDADPGGQDIVINATPLGLRSGDPFAFDPARLKRGAAVVDILMKNQPTPLLQACAAQGARTFPGFEMMIRQAPEYLDFFGLHELARVIESDASEVRRLIEMN